jgi:hypothetical protein
MIFLRYLCVTFAVFMFNRGWLNACNTAILLENCSENGSNSKGLEDQVCGQRPESVGREGSQYVLK